MNDYQYTNPFYEDGYFSGINDQSPYDPSKYTEQKDIENEEYRLREWIAGTVDKLLNRSFK